MKLIYATVISICLLTYCCKKDDNNAQSTYTCHDSAIIDTLKDAQGIMNMLEDSSGYAIQVPVPNTIDEVNVYLICNLTDFVPRQGAHVKFSGYVRNTDYHPVNQPAGTSYFEVEITIIEQY